MMKSFALLFIIPAILLSLVGADECGKFSEFTLFPNPIQVGQTAFLRAAMPLRVQKGAITGGVLAIRINLDDVEVITFNNLPLCNISDSIQCNLLGSGNSAINLDIPVPKIYPGKYTAMINATVYPTNEVFCQSIDLVVQDSSSQGNKGFFSYFEATLAGTAQFANPAVRNRQIGDLVQVGPVGAAPAITSLNFPWGTFLTFSGSEDTISPYTRTNGFVWGVTGNITDISYRSTKVLHTYTGTFTVGYVTDLSKRKMDFVLLDGDFTLTWIFDQNLDSTLTGTVHFPDISGSVPAGWNEPITLKRYGFMDVATSSNGIIIVSANKTYCPAGKVCAVDGSATIISPSKGLTGAQIGIIIGVILGAVFLVAIIVGFVLWRRHKRQYEEEAGIFSSVRKPQYGNALVVDDIIQETREHGGSPELIPPLNRRNGDYDEDDYSDSTGDSISDTESNLSDHRRSRFSGERVAPPLPPYSPASDVGPSRRRDRSPSPPRRDSRRRSPSPQRSRSPPRRDSRRYSPSPPRGRDESESYYSDAGSSASRTSDEE